MGSKGALEMQGVWETKSAGIGGGSEWEETTLLT